VYRLDNSGSLATAVFALLELLRHERLLV